MLKYKKLLNKTFNLIINKIEEGKSITAYMMSYFILQKLIKYWIDNKLAEEKSLIDLLVLQKIII